MREFAVHHLFAIVVLSIWQPYFDCAASLSAQEVEDSVRSIDEADSVRQHEVRREPDVLSLALQVVPSPAGGTFFNEYRKLGAKVGELSTYIAPTLLARLALSRELRATFYAAYHSVSFADYYNVALGSAGDSTPGVVVASINENFSMSVIPVMVGIEYSPIYSQFSSYVGLAVGGAFSSSSWLSVVRHQAPSGYYRPEKNVRELGISPAARIYTGVDLRFDRYLHSGSPFRGIFLEASFLVIPVSGTYFKEIRHQGKDIPVLPAEDNATLNVGGFTVTLGVNLQFLRN